MLLSRKIPSYFMAVAGYGAVSVLTVCLEFAVLRTLLGAGVSQSLSVSAAFIASCCFQFLVLRYVVFRVTDKAIVFQANAYIVTTAFGWLAVLVGVTVLTAVLPIGTLAARALLLPVLFPANYLISRYFVFRP